eukprot:gene5809-6095_t
MRCALATDVFEAILKHCDFEEGKGVVLSLSMRGLRWYCRLFYSIHTTVMHNELTAGSQDMDRLKEAGQILQTWHEAVQTVFKGHNLNAADELYQDACFACNGISLLVAWLGKRLPGISIKGRRLSTNVVENNLSEQRSQGANRMPDAKDDAATVTKQRSQSALQQVTKGLSHQQRSKLAYDDAEQAFADLPGLEDDDIEDDGEELVSGIPHLTEAPNAPSDTLSVASAAALPLATPPPPMNVAPPMQHLQGVMTPMHTWTLGALASNPASDPSATELQDSVVPPPPSNAPSYSKQLGSRLVSYVANSYLKEPQHTAGGPVLQALLEASSDEQLCGIGEYSSLITSLISVAFRPTKVTDSLRQLWDLCYQDVRASNAYAVQVKILVPSRASDVLQPVERALAGLIFHGLRRTHMFGVRTLPEAKKKAAKQAREAGRRAEEMEVNTASLTHIAGWATSRMAKAGSKGSPMRLLAAELKGTSQVKSFSTECFDEASTKYSTFIFGNHAS